MSSITVMHISDLHFSEVEIQDMSIVRNALLADIQSLAISDHLKPDLIIFSGDLVDAGDDVQAFQDAKRLFIDPLLETTALPTDRFFMCPGNHDIQRDMVEKLSYIETGLSKTLISLAAVNEFIDNALSSPSDHYLALSRLENFQSFMSSSSFAHPITSNAFLKTYKCQVSDVNIGIACLNTAWRATGKAKNIDRKHLLLGERAVDLADKDLADCDVRLAVFHHPLEWLDDFDQSAVENRLYSQFNILFSGHIHRNSPEARCTPSGTSLLSQTGCLYQDRDYFNGYQILKYDATLHSARFYIRAYQKDRREFDAAVNVTKGGQMDVALPRYATFQGTEDVTDFLREFRPFIREQASMHMSMVLGQLPQTIDIKESFVCPPLSDRSEFDAVAREGLSSRKMEYLDPDDILKNRKNFFVLGRREAGKSSLAHYLAVRVSEGVTDAPRIPVVVDFQHLRPGSNPVRRAVRTYFIESAAYAHYAESIEQKALILFIDNFDASDAVRVKELKKQIAKFQNIRWVIFADEPSLGFPISVMPDFPDADFRAIHILPLPRRSIRLLSQRWSKLTGHDAQQTFDTVMQQLTRAHLPRTGYIVALILWAMQQEKKLQRINEAVLLQHIVEFLLQKSSWKDLLRKEFDFKNREALLQNIAMALKASNGFLKTNAVLERIIAFLDERALEFDATEIMDNLVECGILNKVAGEVSFKYRCFQEYFSACYIYENRDYVEGLFSDGSYISYSRELDLMSALHRNHADLLERLARELIRSRPKRLGDRDFADLTQISADEQGLVFAKNRLTEIKRKRVSADELDDLFDSAERQALGAPQPIEKKGSQPDPASGYSDELKYFLTLDLLGRTLRNAELVQRSVKKSHALSYFTEWRKLMLVGIQSSVELLDRSFDKRPERSEDEQTKELRNFVEFLTKLLIPTILINVISDQVATPKLRQIFHEILSDDTTDLVIRMFIVFLYLDMKVENWHRIWADFIRSNRNNKYVLRLCAEKLWIHYRTTLLDETHQSQVENLLADTYVALGSEKGTKSKHISEIRKRRIQFAGNRGG